MTHGDKAEGWSAVAEHGFDNSAYLFMTFLYGAAVHLVIAEAQASGRQTLVSSVFVLGLILFLLSDWASRARLPRLLPEMSAATPAGYLRVCKVGLEVTGVFFLVSAFLLLVADPHENGTKNAILLTAEAAFGVFLITTWAWDYVMINIMKDLNVAPLAGCVWTGAAIDDVTARKSYLEKFEAWKTKRQDAMKADIANTRLALDANPENAAFLMALGGLKLYRARLELATFEAAVASTVQFLANHILHANIVAGITLLLGSIWNFGSPIDALATFFGAVVSPYDYLRLSPAVSASVTAAALLLSAYVVDSKWFTAAALGAILVLVLLARFGAGEEWLELSALIAVVFLLSTSCYMFRNGRKGKVADRLGGFVVLFSLVLLYVGLPSRLLIALLAGQQVLANVFLQLGAGTPRKGETIATAV